MSLWSGLGAVGVMRTGPATPLASVCHPPAPPQSPDHWTLNTLTPTRWTRSALAAAGTTPAVVARWPFSCCTIVSNPASPMSSTVMRSLFIVPAVVLE